MDKFYNLSSEKQDIIINAALTEFASTGYKKTSISSIAKRAGISKGLLFYYFNTKKELYLFLYEYCYKKHLEEVEKVMERKGDDFFDIFIEYQKNKIKLMKRHPELFLFINRAKSDESLVVDNIEINKILKRHPEIFALTDGFNLNSEKEISTEVTNLKKDLSKERWTKILGKCNISKFKDSLDIDKLIYIMIWCVDGYMSDMLKGKEVGNIEDYLLFFKENIYK